jgi:hypothetical protein
MTKRRNFVLWFSMILSVPVVYYSGTGVVFYAWLNAAEPQRWTPDRAGLWAGGALAVTILFSVLFIYCVVSLIKEANRQNREVDKNAT